MHPIAVDCNDYTMKNLRKNLEIIRRIKKKRYHPLIHRIHKKHGISRRTLFYIKEYGPHSNISRNIIKESILILLFASVLSSIGGFALENIREIFISIFPLIILMPFLNDMIGNYGTIISSRFATMLHKKKNKVKLKDRELRALFLQIFLISFITILIASSIAMCITYIENSNLDITLFIKILLISMIDVFFLVFVLFFVAIFAGLYLYKKGEDPDNFLIPLTTSIADFGNMIMLALLVLLFF